MLHARVQGEEMKLYNDLGLKQDATPDAIKSAYRRRAKKMHPDAGGKRADFDRLRHAYTVLGDPVRRLKYDCDGTEDTNPTNDEVDALSMLHESLNGLIESLLAGGNDLTKIDLMTGLRNNYQANINRVEKEIALAEINRAALLAVAKRFKVKSGINRMQKFVEEKARGIAMSVVAEQRNLATLQRARDMVADYKFEFDKSNGIWTITRGSTI